MSSVKRKKHETHPSLVLLLLTAGLLFAPVTTGDGSEGTSDPLAIVKAEGLGRSVATGGLAIMVQEKTRPDDPYGHPEFHLEAEILRIETDQAQLATQGTGVEFRIAPETTVEAHEHATLEGLDHRNHYRFSLWPQGNGTVVHAHDDTCSSINPSDRDRFEQTALVRDDVRDPNHAETSQAVKWESCGSIRDFTVQGDFLLRLWEWDAELTTDGQKSRLASGMQTQEEGSVSPPGGIAVGQAIEQYVYAYNATITIPRLGGHWEAFLKDTQLSAKRGFELYEAVGTLHGIPLDHQQVFSQGDDLTLSLTGTGPNGPLSATLDGSIRTLEIDGEPVELWQQTPADEAPRALTGTLALVALVAVGFLILITAAGATFKWHTDRELRDQVLTPWLNRTDFWFAQCLDEALEFMENPQRARRWANIALWIRPNHPEALAAKATAFFNMMQYKKSMRCYKKAIAAQQTEHREPNADEQAVGFWAADIVRCLAHLRERETDTVKRDALLEQILRYARLCQAMDPSEAKGLLVDSALRELRETIQLAITLEELGLTP